MTANVMNAMTNARESMFPAMGTTAHVIVIGDSTRAACALERAEALIEEAEDRWSRFRPDSEISQINGADGQPVRVSEATFGLLEVAAAAQLATGGAFDPTLGAALSRAGYDRDFARVAASPNSSGDGPFGSVADERSLRLDATARTVALTPGALLDLGGIAKGATADLVAEALIADGAEGCCVSIGGDLRVTGLGPDEGSWRIDLACPGAVDQRSRSVRLDDGGVCTSSITKRTWMNASHEVAHHLIDPTTERHRNDGPQTATIIAATATAGEVITKLVFAGGSPDVFDATGLLVDRQGEVTELAGFDAFAADGNESWRN